MKILVIDNYDSFTYNLAQLIGELGAECLVFRNDQNLEKIKKVTFDKILISPGPKTPHEAGNSPEIIKIFYKTKAILGVCLGHQIIAEIFGGKVGKTKFLMHGKTSLIYHNQKGIHFNIKNPFLAARYHSLAVLEAPPTLEITAWTKEGLIMGLRHKKFNNLEGIQYHPESFMTKEGKKIIQNFLKL